MRMEVGIQEFLGKVTLGRNRGQEETERDMAGKRLAHGGGRETDNSLSTSDTTNAVVTIPID